MEPPSSRTDFPYPRDLQQPIGGNNYVNWVPQSYEESLYFQRRQEIEEEQRSLEKRQRLIATNEPDPSKRIMLLSEFQESEELRRSQIDQNRPVITVDVQRLCMKRVDQYIECQKKKPEDNNKEYWLKFVSEFFHPEAKKRWCVSSYNQQSSQDIHQNIQGARNCELCNIKPEKRFEAGYEILADLFKTKYEGGVKEENFVLGEPGGKYCAVSGRVTLIYGQAVQYTTYEELSVVRKGRLLVNFTSDLKILSFEFCVASHEELFPKRLIKPQLKEINKNAYKCIQSNSANHTNLRSTHSKYVSFARIIAKTTEAPMLNEYGFDKKYIACIFESLGLVMGFRIFAAPEPTASDALLDEAVLDKRQTSSSANQDNKNDDVGLFHGGAKSWQPFSA